MKTAIVVLGALALVLALVGTPAATATEKRYEFEFVIDPAKLPTTYFTFAIRADGSGFVADLTQPDHAGAAPHVDACVTAASPGGCVGATGPHTTLPLVLGMTGLAVSTAAPASASVSLVWAGDGATTFTCFWGAPGGLVGLLVIGGFCAFTSFGFGPTWTLAGGRAGASTGVLVHFTV